MAGIPAGEITVARHPCCRRSPPACRPLGISDKITQMGFRIFNTLTQKLEEFVPLDGKSVRMYTCGPTVYHFVHIGNFRTFVFQDLLRRYLRFRGYSLTHVMNITDVEDKIIAGARKEGVSLAEFTKRYEEAFLQDMEALRIERPEIMPRATEHIDEMIALIQRLSAKGLTYQSNGSVYFRIREFPEYGKLSRLELQGDSASANRVDSDEYSKENPRDFALWKASRDGEAGWESPFGTGRPGWHLECSAMSMKYLGASFDIHCGGVDLVFPHHENEIAQSEGATGQPFVKYWVHCQHLIVEGQKMSKSMGNFYTLRDLFEKGCDPAALRYLLFSVHYRRRLNFTFEGVQQAAASIRRVNDFLQRAREIPDDRSSQGALRERIDQARGDFTAALDDDLNVAAALAALFELIREGNIALEQNLVGAEDRDRIVELFHEANQVLDVFKLQEKPLQNEQVHRLIQEREEARKMKDFRRADEIRDQLLTQGIVLEDIREGTRWKRLQS